MERHLTGFGQLFLIFAGIMFGQTVEHIPDWVTANRTILIAAAFALVILGKMLVEVFPPQRKDK